MARKVLISFLGTNDYFPVYYTWGERRRQTTDHRTKFIQEALSSRLCKDWSPNDCIMVFRTRESNDINWKDKDGVPGLKTVLQNISGLKCSINPEPDPSGDRDSYMIPVGFGEQEMWEIFKCVFDKLNKEDEIYFDVTHAFRTIPMFATVLFNYARFLKHTDVKGVYYGAFETLGPLYKIKSLPPAQQEQLSVPIVDLTNIVRLQEINTAAANFRDFGNLSSLSDILYETGISDLDKAVEDISVALDDLDFFIQTCRIDDIREGIYMQTISDRIATFCNSHVTNDAQRSLLREISKQLEEYGFKVYDSFRNVEAAINWAIDHRMIQQAYTMAKEYLISRVYKVMTDADLEDALVRELDANGDISRNPQNRKYKIREALGSILGTYKSIVGGRICFRGSRWRNSQAANRLLQASRIVYDLTAPYRAITERRNHLNHAATTGDRADSYDDYREEFLENWKKCMNTITN
ncbi:MAG: TIGR02221 family CRISPR-associated protein [Muribaculaceae bacterium]|nr:TIGR02221 family CRISPR-associated protein [Muribaculaceae bacterium]